MTTTAGGSCENRGSGGSDGGDRGGAYHKGWVWQHLEGGSCAHRLKEVRCGGGDPMRHLPHLSIISLDVTCTVHHALTVQICADCLTSTLMTKPG